MFLTAENQTITLVNNTPTLLTPDAGLLNIAATSQQNKGIVIGTGSDAVTKVDHCLQTPATSSIVYGTQTFEIVNPDPADWHTLIHRGFTNNSAASLAVEEIGMIAYPGSYANYVLLDRTLYPLTIEIGETKIITYKIQI
jgi:hypothetical protein